MSLILDALRRADAERESDPRRGIHAQPLPLRGDAADYDAPPDSWIVAKRLLPWAAAGVVLLAVLVGWRELRPRADVWTQAEPVAAATRSAPMPAPASQIQPPAPPPAASPAPAAPVPASVPARSAPRVAARPQASATQGWPEHAPRLAIAGGVYSSDPVQRMLIINGDVHSEGTEPVAGVRIEQILPRTAILGFQGQRYEVAY